MTAQDVGSTYGGEVMGRMVSPSEYADAHGIAHRTVQEYLRHGRIPGAVQNPRNRYWRIPLNAPVSEEPAITDVVRRAADTTPLEEPATLRAALDASPVYLDVPTAARLLGCTEWWVKRHARDLYGVQGGRKGSWLIPQRSLRERAGLL